MVPVSASVLDNYPNLAIAGYDNQMLTVTLAPDETILAQPGQMMWCDSGIKNVVSTGGMSNLCNRLWCQGEDIFRIEWTNVSSQPQRIGFTAMDATRIVPINLEKVAGELVISYGTFMAAQDEDLQFRVERAGRRGGGTLTKGIFGGQGFFLAKVIGRGWVFLNAYGTVLEKNLARGESITVDQMAVIAWESSVNFGFRASGGLCMCLFGGEGITQTTLTGPGYVCLQSVTTPHVSNNVPVLLCLMRLVMCCFCWMFFVSPMAGFIGGFEEAELGSTTFGPSTSDLFTTSLMT